MTKEVVSEKSDSKEQSSEQNYSERSRGRYQRKPVILSK